MTERTQRFMSEDQRQQWAASFPLGRMGAPEDVALSTLLVAAVGIVIQIVSGVDFPPIPPGLIILLIAAGLTAFGPWR